MAAPTTVVQSRIGVNVRLDQGTIARVDEQAKRAGISRAALIRLMVEEWTEDADEDLAFALEAKRRFEDPNEEYIPWEQAKAEMGL